MKIRYESKTVEKQCTSVKAANKLFGGRSGIYGRKLYKSR